MKSSPDLADRRTIFGYGIYGICVDLVSIFGVAILLVGIHFFLPAGIREALKMPYTNPDPLRALTSANVHVSDGQLHGNVQGYLLASLISYFFCLLSGERRWFRFTGLAFMTLVPVAVSFSSAIIIGGDIVGSGFSGVVSAFAGFILVTTPVVLHLVFGVPRDTAIRTLLLVFFILAIEILSIYFEAGKLWLLGLLLGGIALVVIIELSELNIRLDDVEWMRRGAAVLVVLFNLAFLTYFIINLYPTQLSNPGGTTNILAHYLGFIFGAGIAGWGYRYWSTSKPLEIG